MIHMDSSKKKLYLSGIQLYITEQQLSSSMLAPHPKEIELKKKNISKTSKKHFRSILPPQKHRNLTQKYSVWSSVS